MIGFGITVAIVLALLLLRLRFADMRVARAVRTNVSADVHLRAQHLGAAHEWTDADRREKH